MMARFRFYLSLYLLMLALFSCEEGQVSPEPPPPPPAPRSLQVWLYHNDDTIKAKHFQNQYAGMELDVHFDTVEQTFFVKHDFSEPNDLRFTYWLSALDHPEELGFWLDFKNLAPWNKEAALHELLQIRAAFHLTQKVIVVESSSPDCLPGFDTLNFRVSYYIPSFDPTGMSQSEQQAYYQFINGAIQPYGIGTISGYYIQHAFMQQWFPSTNKLLWYLDSVDPVIQDSIIAETKKDSTVEVLLVAADFPTDFSGLHPGRCSKEMELIRKR